MFRNTLKCALVKLHGYPMKGNDHPCIIGLYAHYLWIPMAWDG